MYITDGTRSKWLSEIFPEEATCAAPIADAAAAESARESDFWPVAHRVGLNHVIQPKLRGQCPVVAIKEVSMHSEARSPSPEIGSEAPASEAPALKASAVAHGTRLDVA